MLPNATIELFWPTESGFGGMAIKNDNVYTYNPNTNDWIRPTPIIK